MTPFEKSQRSKHGRIAAPVLQRPSLHTGGAATVLKRHGFGVATRVLSTIGGLHYRDLEVTCESGGDICEAKSKDVAKEHDGCCHQKNKRCPPFQGHVQSAEPEFTNLQHEIFKANIKQSTTT